MSMKDESIEAIKVSFPPEGVYVECPETGELVFVPTEEDDDS